ncbi:DUF4442 domain-containing protein [Gynurincola endophyticus]|jgi:hypothetical protein|uniref:DUF4442 domain-containing protein n=1 Tax=Gynurincola endophyticus TaxID=2479004 RepID=UPI001F1E1185|nr:DUF4442 domain-containing protein [Gynurincola endophyticus]
MMTFDITEFLKIVKHPVKGRMFLFTKLPSAYFAGVRVVDCKAGFCSVKVPYKWFSQNPFRSTYFACLSMAAEMSTGILALANIYQRKPGVSMLVVKMEMEYFKKAVDITTFTCNDGVEIANAVQQAIDTKQGVEVMATSKGINKNGEVVAIARFYWSFKAKS